MTKTQLLAAVLCAAPSFAADIVFSDTGNIYVSGYAPNRVSFSGTGCVSDGGGGQLCTLTLNTAYPEFSPSGPADFNIFENSAFNAISDTFFWTANGTAGYVTSYSMTFHISDSQPLLTAGAHGLTSLAEVAGPPSQLLGYFSVGLTTPDSVSFYTTSETPEPATFLLVPGGLVAIGLRSRRKRAA